MCPFTLKKSWLIMTTVMTYLPRCCQFKWLEKTSAWCRQRLVSLTVVHIIRDIRTHRMYNPLLSYHPDLTKGTFSENVREMMGDDMLYRHKKRGSHNKVVRRQIIKRNDDGKVMIITISTCLLTSDNAFYAFLSDRNSRRKIRACNAVLSAWNHCVVQVTTQRCVEQACTSLRVVPCRGFRLHTNHSNHGFPPTYKYILYSSSRLYWAM